RTLLRMFHCHFEPSGSFVGVVLMIGMRLAMRRLHALVLFAALCRDRAAGGDHDGLAEAPLLVEPLRLFRGVSFVFSALRPDSGVAAMVRQLEYVPFEALFASVEFRDLDDLGESFVIDVRG